MVALQQSSVRGWALVIPAADARRVAILRTEPAVEVHPQADQLWLRGSNTPLSEARLRELVPGAFAYWVLEHGRLLPVGQRVPQGVLPEGPWYGLHDWLQLDLPPCDCSFPRAPKPVALQLARTAVEKEPLVMWTSWVAWSVYAATAPRWRLERLSFAANRQGDVLVRGRPLPPLPGLRFWETHGIAVLAGWTVQPALAPKLVRRLLQLAKGEIAVLLPAATGSSDAKAAVLSWHRLDEESWVRAARSAVRCTEDAFLEHS